LREPVATANIELGGGWSPATAEFRCCNDAAAAIGMAREENKGEALALRRVEANRLAADVCFVVLKVLLGKRGVVRGL
jgi:hypothetical protein